MDAPVTMLAGRYRLINRLAAGGMGTVWEAWDELLQRPVAVKQLLPQTGVGHEEAQVAVDRAMREARITARLHHPNAVPVYDVVEHEGRPCLIMQYVPSRSLQQILTEKGVLEPAVVAGIGAEVASALAAAHQAGIVHRDVKPSNVLITEDGTAKLTDFGVSHAAGDVTLTSVGMVTGTPAYLAPEVARGAATNPAADVFSLGATLYAALEGSPPFGTAENPMALLHRVASGQINPPRRSGPLAPLLMRMLAADPADRPPMIDVSHTLSALRADLSTMGDATQRIPPQPTLAGAFPAGLAAPIALAAAQSPVTAQPATAELPVRPPAGPPPPPAQVGPGNRPPRRRALPIALIAAGLVIVLGIVLAATLTHGSGGSPNGQPTNSASRPTNRPSTPVASSSRPSAPSSSAQPSSTPASQPGGGHGKSKGKDKGGTPTDEQLAQAIVDYYALLPDNTDQAWDRLTPRYQNGTAQNRQYFQSFWGAIQSVSTSSVTGSAPDAAQATITYTYKDGRVVVERTAYTLAPQDGTLKIDSSQVLSSQGGG